MKKALAVSVFMCLALAMLGALGSKESGTYPNGPVSVIVPYGAGGGKAGRKVGFFGEGRKRNSLPYRLGGKNGTI